MRKESGVRDGKRDGKQMKRGIDPDISSRMSANGSCFAPERRIPQTLERIPPHRLSPQDEELIATIEEGKEDSKIISNFIIPVREDSSDFGL